VNDQEYVYFKRKILALLSIDLDGYKSQQMRRRLDAFVDSQGKGVIAYCQTLEQDPVSMGKLRDFLTINVTEFFRDQEQYHVLKTVILPELLQQNRKLNIWSAGCSRGAEAYSIAMILKELTPGQTHRILATDIDDRVLALAKAGGPYSPSEVNNVAKHFLHKHFTKSGEGYIVAQDIRSCVEFRRHNLLSHPFEPGFDLIVCRNVTIYFSDDAKRKLFPSFSHSLKDRGILFIGASETLLAAPGLRFEWVGKCFYRKPATGGSKRSHHSEAALLSS